ncbi:Bromodomain-containing protein [Rhizoctonia solani AG-1 IA]|nr:Bromodomain-containing protein [Rhizoctonia solani AG-1 IA]
MEAVLKEMRAHPAAWPFQKPVNTDEVKDYLDVVKKPMGESGSVAGVGGLLMYLSMMDFKLENNSYALIEDFIEDAKLMLDNCKLYNPESTVYHKTAIRMEKALQDILKSVGVDYRL